MKNIVINHKDAKIVITKAFSKKAEEFKSSAYNDLKEAMDSFPTYELEIKRTAKKDNHKGLTFKFMEDYIAKHDNEDGTLMGEYKTFTSNKNGVKAESYGVVREWFLARFPEIDNVFKTRDQIMKEIRDSKRVA